MVAYFIQIMAHCHAILEVEVDGVVGIKCAVMLKNEEGCGADGVFSNRVKNTAQNVLTISFLHAS